MQGGGARRPYHPVRGLLDYYGIEADDTGDALRVIAMEPGIFCLIQSTILALDVLL